MRNEIWSMISQLGAPSWFITLSPADSRHPICLYYADENIEFKPDLRSANELVLESPVQSGLLPIFGRTETETGPPSSIKGKKPDWTAKDRVFRSFSVLRPVFGLYWSQPV